MTNCMDKVDLETKFILALDILARNSNINGNIADKIYFKMLRNITKLKKYEKVALRSA